MNLLSLALLLATSISASTDTMAGFDTTEFWTRSYFTPHSYCHHLLVAEAPSISTQIIAAISCPLETIETADGSVYAICRIPEPAAETSINKLKRLTQPSLDKKNCVAAPEHPELSYKTRHLKEEFAALNLSSASTPGLMGLYDAQTTMLEIIQAKHERAKTPTLEVFISTGGRCAGADCQKFISSRWESSRDWQKEMNLTHDGFKPWNRARYPACMQVEAVRTYFNVAGDSHEAAKIKRTLSKLGEPYIEAGCSRGTNPVFMIYSKKSLKRVMRTLLDIPTIKSMANYRIREANTKTDDQRAPILERELRIVDITKAPHLKALADAERERVQESAAVIRKLKAGVLIVASFEKK